MWRNLLMHYEYKDLASLLRVVAEPNRLKILEMLSCGEMCGCDILAHFDFTQPTLSHHMSILEKSGLVNVRLVLVTLSLAQRVKNGLKINMYQK